ncbi:hypothetical protein G6F31_017771 [Rhizopus arrhizus]|nr:hypothetical protein G6F31_017771 [Rhizopus arrhizus]
MLIATLLTRPQGLFSRQASAGGAVSHTERLSAQPDHPDHGVVDIRRRLRSGIRPAGHGVLRPRRLPGHRRLRVGPGHATLRLAVRSRARACHPGGRCMRLALQRIRAAGIWHLLRAANCANGLAARTACPASADRNWPASTSSTP